jgi:uncharacterized protein
MHSFQPISKSSRLELVDALRGLALLGILAANIPVSPAGHALYQTRGFILGNETTDKILEDALHLFVDKKFITIFSILFGFGFYIQLKNAEKNRIHFHAYYFWRMALLLLIGCLHAYIFWYGDIIRDYAICGMFLLLVYKWPLKRILVTSIVSIVLLTATVFILNDILGLPKYSYDTSIVRELPITNSYLRYLEINATIDPFVNFINDSPITLAFCFGNMLLGFWLGRVGFFHKPERLTKQKNRLIILGATLGVGCSYLFWMVTSGKLELSPGLIWLPFVIVTGLVLQSLFYISLFTKLFHHRFWNRLLSLFAAIGKMALTNYILQTFFYLTFFYHWIPFSRLYAKITTTETFMIALMLFGIQLIFSRWWMSKHDQGPLENIWKELSYRSFKKKTLPVSERAAEAVH